jgi:predicted alpha/beta-hydrolase family hydrolase
MAKMETLDARIAVAGQSKPVSGILAMPPKPRALLILAHGAGAGMRHAFMTTLAEGLAARGLATLRYQFPYMEAGSGRPDRPPLAMATVAAAVEEGARLAPKLPLYAAGKSFGARMSTGAAAAGLLAGVRGIVCFGFPLHMPKKPATSRAAHLSDVKIPILFLQGTRDELAELGLMREVASKLPLARLHVVEGADHGFDVLKRSGRTPPDVFEELCAETARFAEKI